MWIVQTPNPKKYYPLARIRTLNFRKDGEAQFDISSFLNGDNTHPVVKCAHLFASWVAEEVFTQTNESITANKLVKTKTS